MNLLEAQIECDLTLQKLQKCFKPGRKLTLLVRSPDLDDGDIVFTTDDLDAVLLAIRRLKDREPTGIKPC